MVEMLTLQTLACDSISRRLRAGQENFDTLEH